MNNLSKKLWRKDKDKYFSWFGHKWFCRQCKSIGMYQFKRKDVVK